MFDEPPPTADLNALTQRVGRRRARKAFGRLGRAIGRAVIALGNAMPEAGFVDVLPPQTAWQASPDSTLAVRFDGDWACSTAIPRPRRRRRSDATTVGLAPAAHEIEPPDISAAIGRLVYPGHRGAVVRFSMDMLGSEFMAAYPWSPESGWIVRN
jgi:hypothetical protein